TNVRLIVLKPVEVERTVELSGELPSASTYAEFMAGTPDFSFAISVRLFAAPKAGYLPELYRRWGVEDDEALAAWLDDEIDLAAADLRASIVSSAEGLLSLDEAELAGVVAARHPALDVRGVSVVSSRVPDLGLYEEARRLYAAYMQAYRASVEPALADASATAAGEQVRMESLARYGELLERYPGLIDYLAIEAGIAPRPRVIQSAGN
ncbi:MAG: hypothetical protein JXM71_06720, partial [Spirochaetales bacterium]|nr:hypothetical protein [Spirochaetales bacterium]